VQQVMQPPNNLTSTPAPLLALNQKDELWLHAVADYRIVVLSQMIDSLTDSFISVTVSDRNTVQLEELAAASTVW